MRSFNALTAAPTACSLLLTRKTTPRLKIKQQTVCREPISHGNKCNRFVEARRWEIDFLSLLHAMFLYEVLSAISAAVVIVAFVVQEGEI